MATRSATVVVTTRSFSSGALDLIGELEAQGLHVERADPTHELHTLRAALSHAVAWIAGTGRVTEDHFAAAPCLRVLARYGVGVDAVDLLAADRRRVVVTNTPGANTAAVAEHALALTLALLRRIVAGDRAVRAGSWSAQRGVELSSLAVGVAGFGSIGRAYARLVAALGCSVAATDPLVPASALEAAGVRPVGSDRLAGESDLVSLHIPGGQLVVDERWLAGARHGIYLVNTARSDLVDEDAVADAIAAGTVAGYAADTLASEAGAGSTSPLLAPALADRVVISPHVGGQTREAIDRMGRMAVDAVLDVLAGRAPTHPVLARPQP